MIMTDKKYAMIWYDEKALALINKAVKLLSEIDDEDGDPEIQNVINKLRIFNNYRHITLATEGIPEMLNPIETHENP